MVVGSIQQNDAESTSLNSNASISGNWYVPGTPTVTLNGSPKFGGVVKGNGSAQPSGYYITLNSGSVLQNLVTQTNPVTFTPVNNVQSSGNSDININSNSQVSSINFATLRNLTLNANVGNVTVPPGSYGSFNLNSGTQITLGSSQSTYPTEYTFNQLTFNSSSNLVLLGPVIITVENGINVNSSCLIGNAQHLGWCHLRIVQNGLTINSGGTVYGAVEAPTSSVNINGLLSGVLISSDRLTVNSGGSINGQSVLESVLNVYPDHGTSPLQITADGSLSMGTIVSYQWDFGDQTSGTGAQVTHTYSKNGDYLVTLVVTDASGNVDASSELVTVGSLGCEFYPLALPQASLTSVTAGQNVSYQFASPDNSHISWLSWTGQLGLNPLIQSLVSPGNTQFYINPDNPFDHHLQDGDLIEGFSSQADSGSQLQNTLNALVGQTLVVPIFDQVMQYNSNGQSYYLYHMVGAASVKLVQFTEQGAQTNQTVVLQYLGNSTCGTANALPTISWTQPTDGTVYTYTSGVQIPLKTSVSVPAGSSIARVDYFASGASGNINLGQSTTAPYTFTWKPTTSGQYYLTAVAVDGAGRTVATKPISVILNLPPLVSITAPKIGTVIQQGINATITATASDPDGTVASVTLYENDGKDGLIKLTQLTKAPYTYTWSQPPAGTYVLTAVAVDNDGASTTSTPVTLDVNAPPTAKLTTSATNGVSNLGSTLNILSGAMDSDGSVALVEFFVNGSKIGQTTTAPFNFPWKPTAPGTYQLYVRVTDNQGGVTTSPVTTIRINAPPTVTLTAPTAGTTSPVSQPVVLKATAADSDGTVAKVDFYANSGTGPQLVGTVTTAPYNYTWTPAAGGAYTLTAIATDNNGAATTSAPVQIQITSGFTTLTEGKQFLTETTLPITIPSTPAGLSIQFQNLKFDTTAKGQDKDAFELALVSASGVPLVPVIASGRDAFYNQSEVGAAALAQGVSSATTANGITTISVDISKLAPGTKATLVAKLLNNDSDTATTVQVATTSNFQTTVPTAQPNLDAAEPGPTAILDFTNLQNISANFSINYGRSSHDDQGTVYYVGTTLQNTSPYLFKGRVAAIIDSISNPSVSLANPDGVTSTGFPYVDFTPAISGGTLASGASSLTRTFAFKNPANVQFTYHVTLLGDINHPPVFTGTPGTSALPGTTYSSADPATDPDQDTITYSVSSGPAGLTINSTSGLITWPVASNTALGNYQVTVAANDQRGGITQQTFSIAVQSAPPNRPPVFTSLPVVSATFGSAYTYAMSAYDPDGNSLSFSFSGPAGMSLSGSTLNWTPSGSQSGIVNVTAQVSDGKGGTAKQSFSIVVQPAAGATTPLFESTPVTSYTLTHAATQTYQYMAHAMEGGSAKLTYSLGTGPSGAMIDTNTGNVSWAPSIPGQYPFEVIANDNLGGVNQQTYTLTVNAAPNNPPVITSTPITQLVSGQEYQYGVQATDADKDTLTYSLTSAPTGMTISASSGLIDWPASFTSHLTGSVSVSVKVSDGFGGTAVQNFQITPVPIGDGAITGIKFNDLNGNGVQDPGEPGVPGVTMYVDLNNNGQYDPGEPKTITTADGSYVFNNMFAGKYTVREVLPPGSYQTFPGNNNASVTLGTSQKFVYTTTADFGQGTFTNTTASGVVPDQLIIGDNSQQQGSWETIQDGQTPGRSWASIVWNQEAQGSVPVNATLTVLARASDTQSALSSLPFVNVTKGAALNLTGRYLDVLVTMSTTATPTVHNAQKDFSIASNPAGVWSYGWEPTLAAPFVYDTDTSDSSIPQNILYYTSDQGPGGNPSITDNIGSVQNGLFAPMNIVMHPGPSGQESTLRFTAPHTGLYSVFCAFGGVAGTTTDNHLTVNGTPIFNTFTLSNSDYHSFATTLSLNDGDTAEVNVGPDGSFDFDSTNVWFRVTDITAVQLPVLSDLTIYSTDLESTNFGNVSPASAGGDLVVQSIDPSQVVIDPQTLAATGIVNAKIANVGSGTISGSFQVAFFEDVNGNGIYDPTTDNLIGTATVNGILPAGQTVPVQAVVTGTMQFTGAPVSAYVDYTNLIAETNENNNYLDSVLPTALPDLIPSDVRAAAGNGQSAVYTVRIGNAGGSTVPSGVNIAFYNGNPLSGGTFLGSVPTTQTLGTDQYQDVSVNLYNGAAVDLWVAADDDGSTPGSLHGIVTESNKANNVYHLSQQLVSINQPPHFTSTPVTSAASTAIYRYPAIAQDPNGDNLTFSLLTGPTGMSIDPLTGYVLWQPTANQEGTANVVLKVSDGRGGTDLQSYQITVVGAEDAPVIVSQPGSQAIVGLPYQYNIVGQDALNDTIHYGLVRLTFGNLGQVTFDTAKGILTYIPGSTDVGTTNVTVSATNSLGQSTTQTFPLTISTQGVNHPPVITSSAPTAVRLGTTYNYLLQASDPDGDPITETLTQAPTGMTLSGGIVSWTPTASQYGANPVVITVSDGRGGVATQSYTLNVVSLTDVLQPVITSQPVTAGVVGAPYIYNVVATDPSNYSLTYSLTQSPKGMSINALQGSIRWTPMAGELGSNNVTVQAIDGQGGLVTQSFTVNVTATSLPPQISSSPVTSASAGYPYSYTVVATDPQASPLTYSLNHPPTGMLINAKTGLVTWSPSSSQLGAALVEVQVQDALGASTLQDYVIEVVSTPPVYLPQVTSSPVLYVSPGDTYSDQLIVTDPDPTGHVTYSLVSGPTGMTINLNTGLISWTTTNSTVPGVYPVTVLVKDSAGGTSILTYNVTVALDSLPVISSTPVASVAAGGQYQYQIAASQPQGNALSYSVVQGPSGLAVSSTGLVSWTAGAIATYPVVLQVTDSHNKSAQQSYSINVSADITPPTVQLIASTNLINVGNTVSFYVSATDNVAVQSLTLKVAGTPVPINANHIAVVPFNAGGIYTVTASATDLAGNVGTASVNVQVHDPNDNDFPTITFDKTNLQATNGIITSLTPIVATISDAHLSSYEVDVAPIDQIDQTNVAAANPAYKVLATGTANVSDSQVATLDPTVLDNGSYFVRIIASNTNGNTNAQGLILTVSGELKLGRFFYSTTDLNIPLAGIPIQITRTYDTLTSGYSGDFGYGWTLSGVEARVQTSQPKSQSEQLGVPDIFGTQGGSFKIGTTVTITGPSGKRETFTFSPIVGGGDLFGAYYLSSYQPEQGVYDTLTDTPPNSLQTPLQINGDGSVGGFLFDTSYEPGDFYLTTKDGHVYHYTPSGGLVDEHDRNGVSLTFTHTGIFSSTGASISYTRDPVTDRIVAIKDPNGNQITYAYDDNGNLISKTDQAGRKVQYTYLTTPAHYLNQLLDANGNPISKTAYDGSGRLSTSTDALGNITTFIYDPVALTQTTIEPLDPATNTHPTTVTFYDSRGNVTQVTNEIGAVSTSTFDANNNPLVVVPPCGCKTTYTYDLNGNQLTKTDPLGNVITTAYDKLNNPTSVTDPRGNITYYHYDGNGNLTSQIDPLGNISTLTDDDLGRPTSLTDALGHITQFSYIDDPNTGIAASSPNVVTHSDGSNVQFTFNSFGLVTSATDENGNRIQLITDAGGILQQRIDADGSTTSYSYDGNGSLTSVTDALGKTTQMKYDAGFNLIERDGPNGEVYKFNYDQLNRLVNKIDPLGRKTTKNYRADGVVQSITQPDDTVIKFDLDTNGRRTGITDPNGNHTTVVYNGDSQVVQQTDPLGKITSYGYDPAGNISSVTDRLGRIRQFSHDPDNQLVQEQWVPKFGGTPVKTIGLTYDALDHVTSCADDTGTMAMVYDQRSRLQKLTTAYAGRAAFVLNYDYDAGSRVTSVTDEAGVQVGKSYNVRNQITGLTWENGASPLGSVNMAHDTLGDLTTIKRYSDLSSTNLIGQMVMQFGRARKDIGYSAAAYNSGGDTTQTESFNQTEAVGPLQNDANSGLLAQDPQRLQRVTQVQHLDASGNALNQENYNFDVAGQLIGKSVATDMTTYGYDQTGQLLRATHSVNTSANEGYVYDSAGNRLRTGSQATNNTVSSDNLISADSNFTYAYDDEGNLVFKTENATGNVWSYTYDHRNRLVQALKTQGITGPVLSQITYTYDFLDRRIAKTVSGAATQFFYDGDNLWRQVDSSNIATRYLTGEGIDQWLARNNSSGTNWYLTDRLGSIVGITDATGKLINSITYDSYGNITDQSNPVVADQFAFTGREFDQETGLYYFRSRYYNPQLGKFLSEDTLKFSGNDDVLNRYCANSPLINVDPTGRISL